MAVRFQDGSMRKRRDWRRITVFMMSGLLAGIVLWICILWAALKTG